MHKMLLTTRDDALCLNSAPLTLPPVAVQQSSLSKAALPDMTAPHCRHHGLVAARRGWQRSG